MCWAQHDAQWFLKTKKDRGFEEANQLNLRVISTIGRIEARHILNALRIKKGSIKTIPELFKVVNTIMDMVFPKVVKLKLIVQSDQVGVILVKKCVYWQEVKKAGVENEYICVCTNRTQSWVDTIGIKGELKTLKRFSDGDDRCLFEFKLNKEE